MQIQLSQKERMFLEDGKLQEEVCVEKYKNYANQAGDAKLK
jgi:spore coat protein CotF